jgi:hypothetical protein
MSGPPGGDLARRFLAAAEALMPASRREWGRAMLAELDQVAGRAARWRFAAGAARAALTVPRGRRLPWLAAIVLAGAGCAAGAAIRMLAPGAGVAAAVLVPGLPAICAWIVLAARRPARQDGLAGRVVQVAAVAAIAACPVVALQAITRYPQGSAGPLTGGWLVLMMVFSADLTCYLCLVLRPAAPLAAGRRSGLLGLAAALVMVGCFLLHQFLGVPAAATWAAAPAAVLAAVVLAARYDGSPLSVMGAALWAVLLGGLAWFIVTMMTASRAISLDARDPATIAEAHSQGAASVLAWAAADDLGASIMILTFVFTLLIIMLSAWGVLIAQDIRRSTPAAASQPSDRCNCHSYR